MGCPVGTHCSSKRAHRGGGSRCHPPGDITVTVVWGPWGFGYPKPSPGVAAPMGYLSGAIGAPNGHDPGVVPPSCKYPATPETVYGAWSLIDVFIHYEFCSRIFFKTFAVFFLLFFLFGWFIFFVSYIFVYLIAILKS